LCTSWLYILLDGDGGGGERLRAGIDKNDEREGKKRSPLATRGAAGVGAPFKEKVAVRKFYYLPLSLAFASSTTTSTWGWRTAASRDDQKNDKLCEEKEEVSVV
jgi:hypothetical protein